MQTTPTKRKRDDEGNNTDSENDAEQEYKRRKIAQEAKDKEFAQALEAAEAADAEAAESEDSDSESEDKSSAKKMLLDWYLLSEADIVIQGPWSSFVEKALVYSRKNQKIIRCHPLTNTETRKDWIVKLDGWACFQNLLKDTFKGPRAVDIPE